METINIGRLNKRVTILGYVDTVNELNQSEKALTKIKEVWATFAPVRGREYYDAQKIREEVTYKLYCRYVPDITSDLYLMYGGTIYSITSVIDVKLDHKLLEIYAVEDVKKTAEKDVI